MNAQAPRCYMLKQISTIVFYLIISIVAGIITTLFADSIENGRVEKKIRKTLESNVRNAVASFKDSSPDATAEDEVDFAKEYAMNVMRDKLVAREHMTGRPPESDEALLFLFTLKMKNHVLDFYLQKAFLKSELTILDLTDYISGIAATIVVFTIIMVYTEYKKRVRTIQQQFALKHAELSTALERSEALALMGRMSAALAHELKTPLSTISNLIHILPSRLSDEQFTTRFVVLVREELERTLQLIDNLLVYGKEIELRKEEWIDVQSLMLLTANRYHLKVIPDMPANEEILGDRFYLDLLFQNLFRNSREAGADEVHVAVRTAQPAAGTVVEFRCEDNGEGFPEAADLDDLTTPFVTSRSQGGGLGLYLVKKIVGAHDGTLSLSRKEKGASVKISLPGRRVRMHA